MARGSRLAARTVRPRATSVLAFVQPRDILGSRLEPSGCEPRAASREPRASLTPCQPFRASLCLALPVLGAMAVRELHELPGLHVVDALGHVHRMVGAALHEAGDLAEPERL